MHGARLPFLLQNSLTDEMQHRGAARERGILRKCCSYLPAVVGKAAPRPEATVVSFIVHDAPSLIGVRRRPNVVPAATTSRVDQSTIMVSGRSSSLTAPDSRGGYDRPSSDPSAARIRTAATAASGASPVCIIRQPGALLGHVLEGAVATACVVEDAVQDDPDPELMQLLHDLLEQLDVSQPAVDLGQKICGA